MSRAAYRLLHATVGPTLKCIFRIRVEGLENIPRGPVIFAINHQAVIDSICVVAVLPVSSGAKFMAKKEYFEGSGLRNRFQAWFFGQSAIAVDRDDRQAGRNAVKSLVETLHGGESVALHPEGGRAPDTCVYRGKTGFVDIAWQSGAPVVPVGIIGSGAANPPGTILPRIGKRVVLRFGDPIFLMRDDCDDVVIKRLQAEEVMRKIAVLAEMPYIDAGVPRKSK
jgi:1-acyl-sn-glycerol-3-phosphate acyltransferase